MSEKQFVLTIQDLFHVEITGFLLFFSLFTIFFLRHVSDILKMGKTNKMLLCFFLSFFKNVVARWVVWFASVQKCIEMGQLQNVCSDSFLKIKRDFFSLNFGHSYRYAWTLFGKNKETVNIMPTICMQNILHS